MVKFETTAHGNLEVAGMNPATRRWLLWGGAGAFLVAAAFGILAVNNDSAAPWAETCAEIFLVIGGVCLFSGVGGRSPVIFDAKKGEIRSGDSVIAHFANLQRIVVIDRRYESNNGYYNTGYFVALEFHTGRRFDVGNDNDEFTAASLAAAISRVTGRPVEQSLT